MSDRDAADRGRDIPPRPLDAHMTPEKLSGYLSRTLAREDRDTLERHLLVCSECRQDLSAAAEMASSGRRRRLLVAVPIAAAALLTVVLTTTLGSGDPPEPILRGPQTQAPAGFAALVPADGQAVPADSLDFRWEAASADAHYVFTLTDADGDVVFTTRTSETRLALPRSVGLVPDAPYFWYVDAMLEGARSSTTGVREFSVR